MKYSYPAVFSKEDDFIIAEIPDIPHCYTQGRNMEEALMMVQDAAEMLLVDFENEQAPTPKPSSPENLKSDGIVSYVDLDTDYWRRKTDNRAVKKTLSIPSWLNCKAEKAGINFSQVLQDALKAMLA